MRQRHKCGITHAANWMNCGAYPLEPACDSVYTPFTDAVLSAFLLFGTRVEMANGRVAQR